ncbi:Putative protein of unknown function [Podospora comata]|uniref:Uncharacterized protein n=1 Tax=Podospora comata TaxID=48703 RepID=A0ABY6SE60_PODCO|nr:Putative protein of unknown function [Podospora comata]
MLTGRGCYDDPGDGGFIAPSNPDGSYDDEGYDKYAEEDDYFSTSRNSKVGKRGYVIHDVCWPLLEEALSPGPVPLDRVFQILESFREGRGATRSSGLIHGGLTMMSISPGK